MEKNYFLRENKTNKILCYKKHEFILAFGSKFEHILSKFHIDIYLQKGIEIPSEKVETVFFMDFVTNWNNCKDECHNYEAIYFSDLSEEEKKVVLKKSENKNEEEEKTNQITKTKNRNQETKSVGNGEGSLYFSKALNCWVFQYFEPSGKRKTIKQRKKETVKHFKDRVAEIRVSLNNGTYIEEKEDTVKSIIKNHIKQKFDDGITKGRSYKRDKDTLNMLEKCCNNFISKPIQQVKLNDIQASKKKMKKHKQSVIDKMWRLLKKAFAIASSPSVKLIPLNIMNDENLKKPISDVKTNKVKPLTSKERKKLTSILDNEERNHKYRNIIKIEWITGMRIGEVLARTINDVKPINKTEKILHIHNTLTTDENNNVIIGEHTKTYDKETGIDEGERNFPISSELNKIIEEELSNNLTNMYGLLFWDYEKNTFITPQKVNSWLKRINKKYHISEESLHNHRLRHDRITQWKEAGMDLKAIQYLAGHIEGSDVTDEVYIDISQEYAFKEFKKAN